MGGVTLQQTPSPIFVEREGWLCVLIWFRDEDETRRTAEALIDVFREAIDVPQVVVVDYSDATVKMFERARCCASSVTT